MVKTITLPAGYDEVPIHEIPWRIAEAIHNADLFSNDNLLIIKKRCIPYDMTPEEVGETVPIENLNDYDWEELNKACKKSNLPLVKVGMPLSEYRLCEKAFEKSNADWMLVPYAHNTSAYYELKNVEESHREELKNAVSKGDIVVYDQLTHIPLPPPVCSEKLNSACMTISDFIQYAAKLNLQVIVGETGAEQVTIPQTNIEDNDSPPGKMPRTETGKLAVEAAWEIECETGGKTSADIVMVTLQAWANAKPNNHPALVKSIPHGVVWATKKERKEKNYMIEDCGRHLADWYKSRI